MMVIAPNTDSEFTEIRAIALEVWPKTYGAILSEAQLHYMLDMMYSVPSLQQQAQEKKHHFILIKVDGKTLGFASYELNCENTGMTKIHKLYVLSTQQGNGLGKRLIDYIAQEASQNHDKALYLNVNKNNPAQFFYQKLGFTVYKEEVIPIGNGYVMDDYVMKKDIE
ncbi:GNAT family N-acetyltransferase [Flavobacterium sp.]|uniref:GNAT family N-acetyltransferase n=1 Tax=Flavobacterium sp. TaxID=239 RepID=UPI002FDE16D0